MVNTNTDFNRSAVLRAYEFNLDYAKDLVKDLSDEQIYQSPGPGLENHPGFAHGHLVVASALIAEELGLSYEVPDGWNDLFLRIGPGDPRLPVSNKRNLPSKDTLLYELISKHEIVESQIIKLDIDYFARPIEWRFDRYFPSTGDMLVFMCITHEAMHLAQVAAWRRAYGLGSSLGRI